MKHLLLFACLLLSFTAAAQIKVERIRIRVLNGHSGKPVNDTQTLTTVYPLLPYRYPLDARTDPQGIAAVLVPTDTTVRPVVRRHPTCLAGGPKQQSRQPTTVSVAAILSTGVVEQNTCGHKNATPTPGELVVFVRSVHWWQQMTF